MVFRPLLPLLAAQSALVIPTSTVTADGGYLNVYGNTLESCSSDGMALTGYTRSGYCVEQNDDSGSHHICIDLSSLGGGDDDDDDDGQNNQNFCTVTGQSDWCSTQDMPCHEDPDTGACPVVDWCVCQWAFASYIQESGGCDNIQNIVCDAINQQAVVAYQQQADSGQQYQDALDCLVDRCGLDSSHLSAASSYSTAFDGRTFTTSGLAVMFAFVAAITVAIAYVYGKSAPALRTIELSKDDEHLEKKDTRYDSIIT